MTTQAASLELETRATVGKKVKNLRRGGIVPVHLYGRGVDSRSLQCEVRALLLAISAAGGEFGNPMTVTIAGESGEYNVETSEIQWDPRTGNVLHVDFRTVAS